MIRNLLLAVVLFFAQTSVTHSVALKWDPFPVSTPSNPGWYNVYRQTKTGDYCAGNYTWIGHIQQSYANGTPVQPVYTDVTVAPGSTYCYEISFIYTPPGTPNAVEYELSDPIFVGPIPTT